MSVFSKLTSEQLRKAADIKEQISKLEFALTELVGGASKSVRKDGTLALGLRKKRKISAAGIARIKAAQKVRWAKFKQQAAAGKPVIATNGLVKVRTA